MIRSIFALLTAIAILPATDSILPAIAASHQADSRVSLQSPSTLLARHVRTCGQVRKFSRPRYRR